jgi:transcriptional regulator with XRE-family HTH domain
MSAQLKDPPDRVRAWLRKKKLTQEQFSEQIGRNPAQISRVLNEESLPSLEVATRIERLTGVRASSWIK